LIMGEKLRNGFRGDSIVRGERSVEKSQRGHTARYSEATTTGRFRSENGSGPVTDTNTSAPSRAAAAAAAAAPKLSAGEVAVAAERLASLQETKDLDSAALEERVKMLRRSKKLVSDVKARKVRLEESTAVLIQYERSRQQKTAGVGATIVDASMNCAGGDRTGFTSLDKRSDQEEDAEASCFTPFDASELLCALEENQRNAVCLVESEARLGLARLALDMVRKMRQRLFVHSECCSRLRTYLIGVYHSCSSFTNHCHYHQHHLSLSTTSQPNPHDSFVFSPCRPRM
jgi:hypothetical protein